MADAITRYRAALVAVTGIAIVGSIVFVSRTFNSKPASTLRRSNAVHRTSSPRDSPQNEPQNETLFEYIPRRGEDDLGILVIQQGSIRKEIHLAQRWLPNDEQLVSIFGPNTTIHQKIVHAAALYNVLTACWIDLHQPPNENWSSHLGATSELLEDPSSPERLARAHEELNDFFPSIDPEHLLALLQDFTQSTLPWLDRNPNSNAHGVTFDQHRTSNENFHRPPQPGQEMNSLLYYIAEEDAQRKAIEHVGIKCESCDDFPIHGVRYKCANCADFDLCANCEQTTDHPKTHVFYKIKIPMPPLSQTCPKLPIFYPGDERRKHPTIDPGVKQNLAQMFQLGEPKIEALYDQFMTMANVPWMRDPDGIQAAIDQRAFTKAFTSEIWENRLAPNALLNRLFGFYDQNDDCMIGFREYLDGYAYIRGPNRRNNLLRAFQCYDIDGNGFVSRQDFLRLQYALFEVKRKLIRDLTESEEADQTFAALQVIRSGQPISSTFNQETIPPGVDRPIGGKEADRFGDLKPQPDAKTVLDESDPWPDNALFTSRDLRNMAPHQRLDLLVERFEAIIYGPTDRATESGATLTNDPIEVTLGNNMPDAKRRNSETALPAQFDDPDVAWRVAVEAMNELLDRMFKEAEDRDCQEGLKNTEGERSRWIHKIESLRRQKNGDEIAVDYEEPSVATATVVQQQDGPLWVDSNTLLGQIVPTDHDSLTLRERQTTESPLSELLASIGAGVRDEDFVAEQSNLERRDDEPSTDHGKLSLDPSPLPKTKLTPNENQNSAPKTPVHHPPPHTVRPSPERLEHLLRLQIIEDEIKMRGGPGRISYDELETLASQDTTGEIRGLVLSWLSVASF